jgi:hypothetical protein
MRFPGIVGCAIGASDNWLAQFNSPQHPRHLFHPYSHRLIITFAIRMAPEEGEPPEDSFGHEIPEMEAWPNDDHEVLQQAVSRIRQLESIVSMQPTYPEPPSLQTNALEYCVSLSRNDPTSV